MAEAGREELARAEELKREGNEHFKAQQSRQAVDSYCQALEVLSTAEVSGTAAKALGQAVRLNLAACLHRLGDAEEAVRHCDEVLAADSSNAKALYRRAEARRDVAKSLAEGGAAHREALAMARRDLVEAAKVQPGDRLVREKLEEVTEELKAVGGASGFADKLRGGFAEGIQDERSSLPVVEPAPPVVCSVCEAPGHPRCGKELWLEQRAAWLGLSVEQVDQEPESFEDDGTLMGTLRAARLATAAAAEDRDFGQMLATRYTACDDGGEPPELSDSEREMLEDCLDSTERPYPRLKRPLPLVQAVRCAEELWDED